MLHIFNLLIEYILTAIIAFLDKIVTWSWQSAHCAYILMQHKFDRLHTVHLFDVFIAFHPPFSCSNFSLKKRNCLSFYSLFCCKCTTTTILSDICITTQRKEIHNKNVKKWLKSRSGFTADSQLFFFPCCWLCSLLLAHCNIVHRRAWLTASSDCNHYEQD